MSDDGRFIVGYGEDEYDFAGFWIDMDAPACPADCDWSGGLDIDDLMCFVTLFALGHPSADCDADGDLTLNDYLCYQTLFASGCK